jgi:hypothetical protein
MSADPASPETLREVAAKLYRALDGIYLEEINGRLCALPESLPDPFSDDPQASRESKCCKACAAHWKRTREALKAYEAVLVDALMRPT